MCGFLYLLTKNQYEKFLELSTKYIIKDDFGLHTVCNIYYDTADFLLIRRSIEKPVYKEKLRVRSYDTPDKNTKVYIELKKKYEGVVYKRRISLPEQTAMNWACDRIDFGANSQISKEKCPGWVCSKWPLNP